ncbi:MAG TPA: rod shape-determining protein RodA [Pseudomonadales bacterium]|jgi:rod shape determining protein RodA|nr:rod shape-determining protein RodA [Pseudomonadales bacterium]
MSGRDFVRSLPGGSLPAVRRLNNMHLDPLLLAALLAVIAFGLVVLFSALGKDIAIFDGQVIRILLALTIMIVAAQFEPGVYLRWTPLLYVVGTVLLVAVEFFGVIVKGSQRWLEVPGLPRFQPSEIMRIAVPLMVAWYFNERPLPPTFGNLLVALAIIGAPSALIAIQPDLGTGILVASAGLAVIVLAGLQWRWIGLAVLAGAAALPGLWYVMRDYQRDRVLTLFDPERDPLGAGWNIIQSTTAIGSGGVFGKGLFEGTQSHLDFLPEGQTDFIIAVVAEELGLVGVSTLLLLYLVIIARGLYIATQARQTFGRLTAGGLTLTFFVYAFVNIAMVSGLLPVVGVPLPLVSYGGTSAITLLAGFGIVMSIYTHRGW